MNQNTSGRNVFCLQKLFVFGVWTALTFFFLVEISRKDKGLLAYSEHERLAELTIGMYESSPSLHLATDCHVYLKSDLSSQRSHSNGNGIFKL